MNRDWQEDKNWQLQFSQHARAIVQRELTAVVEASLVEDTKFATDFFVLASREKRVACRVRRPEYMRYFREVTFRYFLPSGRDTEFQKIVSGWGDYAFYAIADELSAGDCEKRVGRLTCQRHTPRYFAHYCILNLDAFRYWNDDNPHAGKVKANNDGTGFITFNLEEMGPRVVIRSYSWDNDHGRRWTWNTGRPAV